MRGLQFNSQPLIFRFVKGHLRFQQFADRKVFRAVGCPNCNNTGYRGRKGIFEMMVMNNEIRELAFKRSPANIIRKAAKISGMRSLLDDGKIKILSGITTPAEIARTTQAEGIVVDQPG